MLTDPTVWGDPEVFRPERFLELNASRLPDPILVHFGWGLRCVPRILVILALSLKQSSLSICPGKYFAERIVFHLVTTIISLYKVVPLEGQKTPDPNGITYTPTGIQ
jgi:cytochrome P450